MNATRSHVFHRAILGAVCLATLPAFATLKYQPSDYVKRLWSVP